MGKDTSALEGLCVVESVARSEGKRSSTVEDLDKKINL